MTTGERIKFFRKRRNLTQKQLGDLCGIDEANIRKYETDKQNIQVNTLEKILNALSLSFEEFYKNFIVIKAGRSTSESDQIKRNEEREKEEKELYFLNAMSGFCDLLNDPGRIKAIEQVEMLTKIPEYQKDNSPE